MKKKEKAFKALVIKYESITLEQLNSLDNGSWKSKILQEITGFGLTWTCPLCVEFLTAETQCSNCPWIVFSGERCHDGTNEETYHDIYSSNTTEELHRAIKARAKHMRGVLKNFKEIS